MTITRRKTLGVMAGLAASTTLDRMAFAQAGREMLVIASNQDIPNFDPHFATGYSASFFLRNVYNSLVRVEGNPQSPCRIWRHRGQHRLTVWSTPSNLPARNFMMARQ